MATKQGFQGNCLKCSKRGHKSKDCYSKEPKWCHKCKNSSHSTRDCRKLKPAKDAAKKSAENEENITSSCSFAFTFNDQELSTRGKTTPNLLLDSISLVNHLENSSGDSWVPSSSKTNSPGSMIMSSKATYNSPVPSCKK